MQHTVRSCASKRWIVCPLVVTQMHVSLCYPCSQCINPLSRYAHTHARIFIFSRQLANTTAIYIFSQTQLRSPLQLSCTRRNVVTIEYSWLRRTTIYHLHGKQRWYALFFLDPRLSLIHIVVYERRQFAQTNSVSHGWLVRCQRIIYSVLSGILHYCS